MRRMLASGARFRRRRRPRGTFGRSRGPSTAPRWILGLAGIRLRTLSESSLGWRPPRPSAGRDLGNVRGAQESPGEAESLRAAKSPVSGAEKSSRDSGSVEAPQRPSGAFLGLSGALLGALSTSLPGGATRGRDYRSDGPRNRLNGTRLADGVRIAQGRPNRQVGRRPPHVDVDRLLRSPALGSPASPPSAHPSAPPN